MISIRNAKFAKIGLNDMLDYIEDTGLVLKDETVVEIGSYVGDSTEIFAKRFCEVISIDPFVNGYDDKDPASYQYPMGVVEKQFDILCKKHINIIKKKMTSKEAVNYFNDIDFKVNIIYIDGIHAYEGVKNDIKMWLPLLNPSGWLTGHDYQGKFPGTIKAVDEFKKPDMTFRDTSWVIRIK